MMFSVSAHDKEQPFENAEHYDQKQDNQAGIIFFLLQIKQKIIRSILGIYQCQCMV